MNTTFQVRQVQPSTRFIYAFWIHEPGWIFVLRMLETSCSVCGSLSSSGPQLLFGVPPKNIRQTTSGSPFLARKDYTVSWIYDDVRLKILYNLWWTDCKYSPVLSPVLFGGWVQTTANAPRPLCWDCRQRKQNSFQSCSAALKIPLVGVTWILPLWYPPLLDLQIVSYWSFWLTVISCCQAWLPQEPSGNLAPLLNMTIEIVDLPMKHGDVSHCFSMFALR